MLSRDQTCPSSSSPASGVFSQHLSRTTKDRDCQHQGSVFSIIMTAVKTVNIIEPEGKEKDFSGTGWGKETDPTRLSTKPEVYRSSLISTVGAQPAEAWCPNQGSCHPRCRVWEGSAWRLWTCDPRCRVWEGSAWRLWTCDPLVQGLGRVSLETVDV